MKSLLCSFIFLFFVAIGFVSAQNAAAPAVPVLDSVAVQPILGKYDTGGMGNIIVSWDQGKVIGTLEGQGSAPLVPTATADVFNIEGFDGTATFIRDETKKVIKVKLEVQGQTIEGTRL